MMLMHAWRRYLFCRICIFWCSSQFIDASVGRQEMDWQYYGNLGILISWDGYADTEAKFLIVRTLLGAAEAGFFPGMIYLTSLWFPQQNRASIMGLLYGGALSLTLGSPLSGALLEMHGFMGNPGWYWMFMIEGLLAVVAGFFTFYWLDDTPQSARFLSNDEKQALLTQLASEEDKKVASYISEAIRGC